MKTKIVTIAITVLALVAFCFSAFSASAATETEITSDGWIRYTRLKNVTVVYGSEDEYQYLSLSNIPIPYQRAWDLGQSYDTFFLETELYNYNASDTASSLVTVKPGEAAVVASRLKIWTASSAGASLTAIDPTHYGCRIYFDDNYSSYIVPEITSSTTNGVVLNYTFTNRTDKDITLSRISFGVFQDDAFSGQFSRCQIYIGGLTCRVLTQSQLSSQEIRDAIDEQTTEILGGIDSAVDDITGGWNPEPTPPDGSEVVDDYISAEDELLDISNDALAQALSLFNSLILQFGGFLGDFTVIIGIFNIFESEASWLIMLCLTSLSFGFLGFAMNLFSRSRRG